MDCIYLAAGLGVRMRKETPKQFTTLLGKPIMIHALEVLERTNIVEKIIITCHPKFMHLYEESVNNYNISKCILIKGGDSRHQSVQCGLEQVDTDYVLIHEAARPFITEDFIIGLTVYNEKAIIPTTPIPFTVSEGQTYMERELERNRLHNIQLPQLFHTKTLMRAHEKARKEKFEATEDGVLVFRLGEKVRFVPGIENNIKITTPLDLIVAEHLCRGVEG